MITEYDARAAVANRAILADDTRETAVIGQAIEIQQEGGGPILVRLVSDAADEWADIANLTHTAGLAKCGRCNMIVTAASIDATGPYLTCPPCTEIIRS